MLSGIKRLQMNLTTINNKIDFLTYIMGLAQI